MGPPYSGGHGNLGRKSCFPPHNDLLRVSTSLSGGPPIALPRDARQGLVAMLGAR